MIPVVALTGMYIYGKYLTVAIENKQAAFSAQQERAATSGNGFGGDVGMDVIDSGFRVDTRMYNKQFFWIDHHVLLFKASKDVNAPEKYVGHILWNIQTNTMKPLVIEGMAIDFFDEKLRHVTLEERLRNSENSKKSYRYQSTLEELDDRWILIDTESMEDRVGQAPDRYEVAWTKDHEPWFRLKKGLRLETDLPEHKFDYLREWGWILRTPALGSEFRDQSDPNMGFIDVGGAIYANQQGRKVADLGDVLADHRSQLSVTYSGFLDMYWIATSGPPNDTNSSFMGLLKKDGSITTFAWPSSWPTYRGIPLPTKKGIFWSGPDFRIPKHTMGDSGVFIRNNDDQVYKLAHGSAGDALVSNDGCRIAFFNVPQIDSGAGSLKVANVCTSTKDGRGLSDVDY